MISRRPFQSRNSGDVRSEPGIHDTTRPQPGDAGRRLRKAASRPRRPSSRSETTFERLGAYRVLAKVGQGGMGDVYEAYDDELDRRVAIKLLPAELARDDQFVHRFRSEASAVAQLAHPNVVQVYALGRDEGQHYFVMQFVEGESLAQRLRREGRLPLDEALNIFGQCLEGLAAAHAANLVHRDLKPGNILLDAGSGRALLADFGLAKRSDRTSGMTATGVVLGSVNYLSPEQARGLTVDARADLYSMGVLLYETLSGSLPFSAETATAMVFQHAYERPRPLSEALPGAPPPLERIVDRLLEKDPAHRYQSVEHLLTDLRNFREGRGLPAAPCQDDASAVCDLPIESPVLPGAKLLSSLGWRRWVAGFVHDHTPAFLQELRGTTQQVDGAIAAYQRRRDELAALLAEARDVLTALTQQTHPNGQAEDIRAQGEAHQAQVAELELRLGRADATLARLRSQRELLQARLKAARARLSLEARLPRRWSRSSRIAVCVVVLCCAGLAYARLSPTGAPSRATLDPPAEQAVVELPTATAHTIKTFEAAKSPAAPTSTTDKVEPPHDDRPAAERLAELVGRVGGSVIKESRADGTIRFQVNFSDRPVTAGDLAELAAIAKLAHVTSLSLARCPIGDVELQALRGASSLEFLTLDGTQVTGGALVGLGLTGVKYLYLKGVKVDDASLSQLWPVSQLNLSQTAVTDAGLAALGRMSSLSLLLLDDTRVTDEGVEQLGQSQLRTLSLSGTDVTGLGVAALERSPLEHLNLSRTPLTDEGLKKVARLWRLRGLSLASTGISGQALASLNDLPELDNLDLTDTSLTDADLDRLENLPRLRHLVIDRTAVTDDGLERLKRFPALGIVYARDTQITRVGAENLVASVPQLSFLPPADQLPPLRRK